MRIIGYHTERPPGPRWPTPDEIRFTHDAALGIFYRYRKGVIRFRNADEADAHMRLLVADAEGGAAGGWRGWLTGTRLWRTIRRIRLAWG